ncbi:MAG: hypothetical protein ABIB47_03925 [Candidatus Woesearchaeota archaeon]
MASTKVLVVILVFCVFALGVLTTSFVITGMPTVNVFTKPDFERYPDLILRDKNMEILDFSGEKEATYYYSIIGTRIPFTIGERNFFLEVKDVAFDGQGEEYAMIRIGSSGMGVYEYLYVNQEVELDFYGEKLKLIAESIIDGDNIEYLTLKGVIEEVVEPESEPQVEEDVGEETPVEIGTRRDGPLIGQNVREENPEKIVDPVAAWLIAIVGSAIVFFVGIVLVFNRKGPRVFRREL